jgi:hypothetical protein
VQRRPTLHARDRFPAQEDARQRDHRVRLPGRDDLGHLDRLASGDRPAPPWRVHPGRRDRPGADPLCSRAGSSRGRRREEPAHRQLLRQHPASVSTAGGGEWVDIEAATDLGVSAWIEKPRKDGPGSTENAGENEISGYYRNLVNSTLNNIKGQLKPIANLRTFPDPISLVFSGATSMTGNFIELVATVYREPEPAAAASNVSKEKTRPVDRLAILRATDTPKPAAARPVDRLAALRASPGNPLKPALSQAGPAMDGPKPSPQAKPAETPQSPPKAAPAPVAGKKPAAPVRAEVPAVEENEEIDLSEVAMQLETTDLDLGLNGAAERRIVDFRRFLPASGRGLDVGTSNVVGAVRAFTGASPCNVQRNAFLDVRSDAFTEKLLMKLGVDRYDLGPRRFVIGNPAFEFANIFEKATRRPMKNGVISPVEPDAVHVEGLVIRSVLGKASEKGEICAYSIQADPIDVERNAVYHAGAIETILKQLGYAPRPVLEGQAVVYAELAEEDYTGIGISCGGGMFNVCISYKSLPALSFSISRGGDWIDANVAQSLGLPSSQVCATKESGIDLNDPKGRVEEAICIYYRNLIHYSIETIRERFETASNMPAFRAPISVVCSGGTSMIRGFIDVFRQEFETINFPIAVKEIRRARDPLRTVARGCLEAALLETRVNAEPAPAPKIERASVSSVSPAPARPAPPAAARTQVQEPGKSPWWVVIPKPERNRPLSGPACA